MTKDKINNTIQKAINSCIHKSAQDFTSLFTDDAQIILKKDSPINKFQLEKITADYFANLEYKKIHIHAILIEENKAFVEWTWQDYNMLTKQKNCHDNVISMNFKDNLISLWREYKHQ